MMGIFRSLDLVERLNFVWTSLILLVFISVIGILQQCFPGSAINCWCPAQFESSHLRYTEETCSDTEKMYVFTGTSPTGEHRYGFGTSNVIPIPMTKIIILMLLGFKLPELIKSLLGICLRTNLELMPMDSSASTTTTSLQIVKYIVDLKANKSVCRTVVMMVIKVCIGLNILIQYLFVANYFTDSERKQDIVITTNHTTGEQEMSTIIERLFIFPKTVYCRFNIRQMQNVHEYSVQCDVPVNSLYENFLMLFEYWLIGLGIITLIVSMVQISTLTIPSSIKLRFGYILSQGTINTWRFGLDDTLIVLEDVRRNFGVLLARDVASRLESAKDVECFAEGDSSNIPLIAIQKPPVEDINVSFSKGYFGQL